MKFLEKDEMAGYSFQALPTPLRMSVLVGLPGRVPEALRNDHGLAPGPFVRQRDLDTCRSLLPKKGTPGNPQTTRTAEVGPPPVSKEVKELRDVSGPIEVPLD